MLKKNREVSKYDFVEIEDTSEPRCRHFGVVVNYVYTSKEVVEEKGQLLEIERFINDPSTGEFAYTGLSYYYEKNVVVISKAEKPVDPKLAVKFLLFDINRELSRVTSKEGESDVCVS